MALSEGSIDNILCGRILKATREYEMIKEAISKSPVIEVDQIERKWRILL